MSLKGWTVKRVERSEIRDFIEKWHYSKSINGCIADYCYALFDTEDIMKGAMFYGRLAMANQWKRFADKPTFNLVVLLSSRTVSPFLVVISL